MSYNENEEESIVELLQEHDLDFDGDVLNWVQEQQLIWANYNFGDKHGGDYAFKGMVEELGELSRALLKYGQNSIRGFDNKKLNAAVKDAVGDLLVFLCNFCSKPPDGVEPFNASNALEEVWQEVRKRDWKRFPKNGKTE